MTSISKMLQRGAIGILFAVGISGCVAEAHTPRYGPGPGHYYGRAPAADVHVGVIIAPHAPPPRRHENVPRNHSRYSAWKPGHWQWTANRWDWSPGRYVRPPHQGARWTPGRWEPHRDGGYAWKEGRWH